MKTSDDKTIKLQEPKDPYPVYDPPAPEPVPNPAPQPEPNPEPMPNPKPEPFPSPPEPIPNFPPDVTF
ncbi:MAG: hypothetical protein ACR2N3_15265 [Pyrinomonadaceae bacterium]